MQHNLLQFSKNKYIILYDQFNKIYNT